MPINPQLRFSTHDVWITLLLFGCLLLFTWVRIASPKKIPMLISGFFKGGFTEENAIALDSVALFIIFLCSASLLALQAFHFYEVRTHYTNVELFSLLAGGLLGYYLFKTIALLLCGTIFRVESNTRDYISEIYSSAHLAAVVLFPAAVILIFVNNINGLLFEKSIAILLLALLLYRTIKMFILMMNKGLSIVYLFLYLCTLEIIPLVLLFEYGKSTNL